MVGGGNTAIDSARMARRMGSEVTVLYRRVKDDLPAIPDEVEEAEKEGVKFLFQAVPTKASGKERKNSSGRMPQDQAGKTDASGRRTPIAVKGSNFHLKADSLILAVGERADLSFLPENIATENGRIAVDSGGRTKIPRVFAGGDAATGEGFVSQAIASGRKGAEAIDLFLRGESAKPDGDPLRNRTFCQNQCRLFPACGGSEFLPCLRRREKKEFLEIHKGLSGANARKRRRSAVSAAAIASSVTSV